MANQECRTRFGIEQGTRRRVVAAVVLCLVVLGLASGSGCKKRERPGRPVPSPGAKAPGKPDAKAPAERELPSEVKKAPEPKSTKPSTVTEFTIEIDRTDEVVKVVGKKAAQAPLGAILEQAYQTDQKTTSKVVKSWMTDKDILSTADVRDLLEASWNKDSKEATKVLRSWFVERMTLEISDIPALLTKAWGHDPGNTRDVLRTWGDSYGFVDISDADTLARHKFVVADDVDQIRKAVRDFHGNNWTAVAGVPLATRAPEEVPVQISWASRRWIGSKELRFRVGDERLAQKQNMLITLAPKNLPDAGIPVVVDCGVDLPENWVQVQDEDFVTIVAKWREVAMPERNSKQWKKFLRLGVVPGSVYL